MELIDVVRKLVGPIAPVGETHTDDARFENLKVMTALIHQLTADVSDVLPNARRNEFSMRRAGEHASKFFDEMGIVE